MDNKLNFGMGNNILGGGANQALNEAIARRQTGQASPTQAVSPAASTFDPSQQAPTLPSPESTPSATVTGGPSASLTTGAPQQDLGAIMGFNTAPENDLIIKALSQKLRNNAAIEKARGGM